MKHFSDAREPTGDKVRYSYLLFLVAYVNLVTISKSTDSQTTELLFNFPFFTEK